jgi:hypothetical protein
MDEKFIVVWTIDGETTSIPHATQDAALHQAEQLLREHGCDLEIILHLDEGCNSGVSLDSQPFESKTRPAYQSGRLFGR